MAKSDEAKAREQRLAAKLRENLRRRKSQARARAAGPEDALHPDNPDAAKTGPRAEGDNGDDSGAP
ncbi:hypothetical protein EMQ25_10615 [Arsenicitalea aurantiaca]|uniref:Uncharacterized protein n=1 Tax=Arsenicitalea aurantiaca TaxID=1783274 RepID=A0A433XB44_9HYPH|nr:hypothetical protein [Arsenicitalea aurantiaca]RUT31299.1 hypothetical protein EMQ25_10615 [Arsenicitalea aurantiaca]